jgi:hypothetical protein
MRAGSRWAGGDGLAGWAGKFGFPPDGQHGWGLKLIKIADISGDFYAIPFIYSILEENWVV